MDEQTPELEKKLHVVVFPWLAIGHLIPFFHLSISLAKQGIQISFVSTPKNLQKIPQNLSSLMTLVSIPLNHDPKNLPESAESSNDIPIQKTQYLKKAFDGLELPLTNYLINSKPDYIIHDYASYWVPKISENLGIPCVFLWFHGFIHRLYSFTTTPKWITFPTDIVYRTHEVLEYFKVLLHRMIKLMMVMILKNDGYKAVPDTRRFGMFESDWLSLLNQLYKKPVIPLGFLPPPLVEDQEESNNWVEIKTWLDKQKQGSVIYVALGTEAALSQEQVNELAVGLESSGLPFFWVLRKPLNNSEQSLPSDLKIERVDAPSLYEVGASKMLATRVSVEGLAFGRVLVFLPMLNDQGFEFYSFRREKGWSKYKGMNKTDRQVLRNNAKEMIDIFGNEKLNVSYVNDFVQFLKNTRIRIALPLFSSPL
ncbi:hypothetical protein MKW92_024561 [Papaver armeniacum]|nr:hypothetical protein MKW92_024561 [Papaver armeniacum]